MALVKLQRHLRIARCPHCGVDRPNLATVWENFTTNSEGENKKLWRAYVCARCGGITTACANDSDHYTDGIYPYDEGLPSDSIPAKARAYLEQAIASRHAPAGAVMLSASSVDAMLKEKGYSDGSLYSRIDAAADDGLITEGMAKWAHRVRLDSNDQRHADVNAGLPSPADAKRSIAFTDALAQFLFVLPAMVVAGLDEKTSPT
jgi:hypothetical protein